MSKLTIDISKEANQKLKQKAKEERRSLTQEVAYLLEQLVANDFNITNPSQTIDLTSLPEGTTIKTKTIRPKTPEEIEQDKISHFKKLAKSILGRELDEEKDQYEWASHVQLDPTNSYYPFAEKQEGKFLRYAYTMPEQKQKEYLEEWKKYE